MKWTALMMVCLGSLAAVAGGRVLPVPPGVKDGKVTGPVKERLEGGGYVYLLIGTAAGDQWAAVPISRAQKGQNVTVAVQAQMGGFESAALKRKFERIFFGTAVEELAEPTPAHAPSSPTAGAAPRSATGIGGTVKEVLQVPNYTYLRLETSTGDTWAAVPSAQLTVGQVVRVEQPARMDGFSSKALGRTFDSILFGTLGEVSNGEK